MTNPRPIVHRTQSTRTLIRHLNSGKSIQLNLPGRDLSFLFQPKKLTTENFQISLGPESSLQASVSTYGGRQLESGLTRSTREASLAIVNDALSLTFTLDGLPYRASTNPDDGLLILERLQDQGACDHDDLGGASITSGKDLPTRRIPITLALKGQEDTPSGSGWVEHGQFLLSPKYDASLKDMSILMVCDKETTGADPAAWPTLAARTLSDTGAVADLYERQLGLRYLLSEIVLVPDDSSYEDPIDRSLISGSSEIELFTAWVHRHRPQKDYNWGHAMGLGRLGDELGGWAGYAWLANYGDQDWGFSISEPQVGRNIIAHELGHNIGASHTPEGMMRSNVSHSNESFYVFGYDSTDLTAADQISNYMRTPKAEAWLYGPAPLRIAKEIPFANDDQTTTPEGTSVTIDLLANDDQAVLNGATNNLTLLETGAVIPPEAGTASITNNQLTFTPSPGFTGVVWLTYTIQGDVGNNDQGWLHAADLTITVGEDSTLPETDPAPAPVDDTIHSTLTESHRFNPLLNDLGPGVKWGGPIELALGPDGTGTLSPPEASSYFLVNATLVTGTGTLTLESRDATYGGVLGSYHTGYMTYTPGPDEPSQIVISYLVSDDLGNQETGTVTIEHAPNIKIQASSETIAESNSSLATITLTRSLGSDQSSDCAVSFLAERVTESRPPVANVRVIGASEYHELSGQGRHIIPAGQRSSTFQIGAPHDGWDVGSSDLISIRLTAVSPPFLGVGHHVSLDVTDGIGEHDYLSTSLNTPAFIDLLANDAPPGMPRPVLTSLGNPTQGTATLQGDQILYSPPTGYLGTDSLSYEITDGTDTTTLTLTVDIHHPDGDLIFNNLTDLWLPCDERFGHTVHDAGGAGIASLSDSTTSPTWAPGKQGGGLHFDGIDDVLVLDARYQPPEGTSPRTVAAWIKTPGRDPSTMIATWGGTDPGSRINMLSDFDGRLRIAVASGFVTSKSLINDDQWHFVSFTFEDDGTPDVTDIKLYIDGQLEEHQQEDPQTINTGTSLVNIGGRTGTIRSFHGLIDEVHISRRALSLAEIQELMRDTHPTAAIAWHQRFFGQAPLDWLADDDDDGFSRLTEFAFAGLPHHPDSPNLVSVQQSGNAVIVNWPQAVDAAPWLTLTPTSSPNLLQWQANADLISIRSDPLTPGKVLRKQATFLQPTPAPSSQFFRLEIQPSESSP